MLIYIKKIEIVFTYFISLLFQMVLILKKEVVKTNNVEYEDTGKYRQLLVRTLHQCSVKFPDVASAIIPVVSVFCYLLGILTGNTNSFFFNISAVWRTIRLYVML